jgi:adenylate kinase family enzyme
MKTEMRRVVVLGRAGAGKTTVARGLGDALNVPVIHLDALYWNADWTPVRPDSFAERQRAVIARDSWVLDGNYTSAAGFPERLDRADAIVIVEAPMAVCVWRVIRRWLAFRGRARPDLGASERLTLSFLRWIWTWSRRHPDFASEIRSLAPGKPVLVTRSDRDVEGLLADARAARASNRP